MVPAQDSREGEVRASAPAGTLESLARKAAQLADAPIALVTFVDDDGPRWVHAAVGLADKEAARHAAFAAWAVHNAEVLWAEDAAADARLADNPLVMGTPPIRHYAAAPIAAAHGRQLGAICVFDRAPRPVDPTTLTALEHLAEEVSSVLLDA